MMAEREPTTYDPGMDRLLILLVLVILALAIGGGGYYFTRPNYTGAGAGLGAVLYAIAAILVAAFVLRLVNML